MKSFMLKNVTRIFLVVMLLALPALYTKADILELLRSDLRAEKQAIVTAAMSLSESEGSAFWPIYKEYELDLSKVWDERFAALSDYAENYEGLTNEKAKEIFTWNLNADKKYLKLRKKYFNKISKAISPIVAARFGQIENYLNMLISTQIMAEVPIAGLPE
jgi:hypothetical protein